jgi:oxygen-independent coproporphyrinogen-3 oxidase
MPTVCLEPRSVYIHVPFCAHRCGYCDFTLVAGREELIGDYLRGLEWELSRLERPRDVETLFVGGGTPSHLPPPQLARLMELLRQWYRLAEDCEFSVEANPAGFDQAKIDVLLDAGVNRVSLGVQSFDDPMLSLLERDHHAADVVTVMERLRGRCANVSFDLIFGVPGQTLPLWRETLKRAIELGPTHVSTYGLTFERGTSFWSRRRKGQIVAAPEELERAMYAAAMDDLAAAGFEQYEISSFARPGYRCRHNQVYWSGRPYFGFGPGAARYINGRRESNHRSVTTWLKRVLAGESPVGDAETLSPEERARERIVLGLRRTEGLDRDEFRRETGFDVEMLAAAALARHHRAGLLEIIGSRIRLTREGRFLADSVIVDFL